MFAIEINNIEFGYRESLVLKGISFNIEKGEFVSIIGPNGSGKSTLLKTLNNLYIPKNGSISVDREEIDSYKKKDLAKKIAMVPQDTAIDYEFTVEDIVMMGRNPYKGRFQKDTDEDYKIVYEALEMTNTLYLKDRLITEISGGERQRVVIAKALAQKPSIILLDEPTSHLDINHQMDILNLLRRLNKEKGTTIILVIHDINLASRYSDKIVLINHGKIQGIGTPEEVITINNMESTYNMKVAIEKNKYTDAPYLTPIEIRKKQNNSRIKKIHIISGGGSGQEVINKLFYEGYSLSLGVLNVGDSDWNHGKTLRIPIIEEEPFNSISDKSFNKNLKIINKSDIVVITNVPIGSGNIKNLQVGLLALKAGKKVYYVNGSQYEKIDYTNGEGLKLLEEMKILGLHLTHSVEELIDEIRE